VAAHAVVARTTDVTGDVRRRVPREKPRFGRSLTLPASFRAGLGVNAVATQGCRSDPMLLL
jgi:hypothetical protein